MWHLHLPGGLLRHALPGYAVNRPRIRYGILDDEGEVVRWVWEKPAPHYRYIVQRVQVAPAVDWSDFEPAPF